MVVVVVGSSVLVDVVDDVVDEVVTVVVVDFVAIVVVDLALFRDRKYIDLFFVCTLSSKESLRFHLCHTNIS